MFRVISFVSGIVILCSSFIVFAHVEDKVKLQGTYQFHTLFYNHNVKSKHFYETDNNKHITLNSSASAQLITERIIDDLLKLGLKLGIHTTTNTSKAYNSELYLISDSLGKLELGSGKSAMSKMRIVSSDLSVGADSSWDSISIRRDGLDIIYLLKFTNFLDAKMRHSDSSEYSRKISYYTPILYGIQFGFSYVPDSSNLGYKSVSDTSYYQLRKSSPDTKIAVSNAIAYGLSWKYNISDYNVKISCAFVGEHGYTKLASVAMNDKSAMKKFKNLNSYTIGSRVDYQNYSVAASYGNYLRSFTSPEYDTIGRDAYLYSIAGKYKLSSKIASSVHYIFTNHKSSKFHAITAAVNYSPVMGIETFVEATRYNANGKFFQNSIVVGEKTRGNIFVLGAKLYF